MSNETMHTPADVRELAGEIIRSLDLIARNYDSYEYGLPVMTHYDEMVDTVVALLRAPRGEGKAVRLLGLAMERAELLCQDAGRAEWPLSDFGRDMLQARLDTVRDLIGDALALLRTPRGEGCRMVDETYCATHDCGAHDDEKCGHPGCQHCDAQTVGDRHRLSRHLLALASVIEDGGKLSNSVADDVRRAASALVYTPPPHAMRQVTDRLASLLDADADWLHDEALAGRLPDRCQAVAERIRAARRGEGGGE